MAKAVAAESRSKTAAIYLFLLLATLAVFVQVGHFDFVNFDDPDYVTANPHVIGGFKSENVAWAFTSGDAANWFPVTRLSEMLDCQLFGLNSGAHHLTNMLLHAMAVLLLFAFLHRATGTPWPSAWVALLFAVHPLHVESVAWVAERKDVLSALFAMLCLWSYVRWVERPHGLRYAAVFASLALGLMAKPMLVTLPLVLVLLDIWPLRRGAHWREKLPLLVLSLASAIVTLLVQQAGGAVRTVEQFPWPLRLENGAVSCALYLWQWFWPAKLAVFYPYPATIPAWQVIAALLVLAWITWRVWSARASQPYLAVGWSWYLIMLAPVLGLVQVGAQAHADRYTYLPTIGIAILMAFGASELLRRQPGARMPILVLAVSGAVASAAAAYVQTATWQNSRTLFQHAVDVTQGNYLAHHNLGVALAESPDGVEQAINHHQLALRLKPDYARAHTDLGSAFAKAGRTAEAMAEYRAAVAIDPDLAIPHNNLGNTYAQAGRWNEAISEYNAALRLDPDYADARHNLAEAEYNFGLTMAKMEGHSFEAVAHLQAALRIRPDYPEAHNNLGVVLSQDPSRIREAIGHFQVALRIDPNYADAHVNLGVALSQIPGGIPEAIVHLQEADRIQPDPEIRQMVEKLKAQAK